MPCDDLNTDVQDLLNDMEMVEIDLDSDWWDWAWGVGDLTVSSAGWLLSAGVTLISEGTLSGVGVAATVNELRAWDNFISAYNQYYATQEKYDVLGERAIAALQAYVDCVEACFNNRRGG